MQQNPYFRRYVSPAPSPQSGREGDPAGPGNFPKTTSEVRIFLEITFPPTVKIC